MILCIHSAGGSKFGGMASNTVCLYVSAKCISLNIKSDAISGCVGGITPH